MRRVVIDMQNALFADAVAEALRRFDPDFDPVMSDSPALLSALQSHTKPTPQKKSYNLLGKTKANSILIPVITVASRFQMRCLMLKFWNVSSVRP